jgi:glycosyltransferase involved in cell wall biosynthesis
MLSGETILCFAPDPWAGLWRNRHQIMTRLARRNTVVYVEPRMYLGETWRKVRAGKITWPDLAAPRLTETRENLYVYRDPVYAPYAGRLSGGPLTQAVRRRAMSAALRSLNARAPILWLLRPFHSDQVGLYGEKLTVYHVTDEYSGFPTVTDKAGFPAAEEALLRRADVVFVTSHGLLESKGRYNECTFLVPNAVDYEGFRAALAERDAASAAGRPQGSPVIAGLERIAGPRIGYVGALNEKIDFALLAAVARLHPEWQFVLVGSLDLTGSPDKADELAALHNVHWTGRVPIELVPHAIAAMDVCLLPYEQSPWTAAIDSLKLYEYFACGRPVVATDVPAARAAFAEGLVYIGNDPQRFGEQLQTALAEKSAESATARKAAAAANTWDDRVAQIEKILAAALMRKNDGVRGLTA